MNKCNMQNFLSFETDLSSCTVCLSKSNCALYEMVMYCKFDMDYIFILYMKFCAITI